jgi:hypothetical protein
MLAAFAGVAARLDVLAQERARCRCIVGWVGQVDISSPNEISELR